MSDTKNTEIVEKTNAEQIARLLVEAVPGYGSLALRAALATKYDDGQVSS